MRLCCPSLPPTRPILVCTVPESLASIRIFKRHGPHVAFSDSCIIEVSRVHIPPPRVLHLHSEADKSVCVTGCVWARPAAFSHIRQPGNTAHTMAMPPRLGLPPFLCRQHRRSSCNLIFSVTSRLLQVPRGWPTAGDSLFINHPIRAAGLKSHSVSLSRQTSELFQT